VVANSKDVAAYFGKTHKNVLRDISVLLSNDPRCRLKIEPTSIQSRMPNGGTRQLRAFDMTRDGFTLLAMGFTGKMDTRPRPPPM
jgi:Rha family phage regulatory protein